VVKVVVAIGKRAFFFLGLFVVDCLYALCAGLVDIVCAVWNLDDDL
jgi:hypothetical protein